MPLFLDQLGSEVYLEKPPKRIISLVPSQTELLVDLGLADQLVGVTKFCVHPKGINKEKAIVGGTKKYNFQKIDALHPHLIIGNKEENEREGIAFLSKNYPVWMSDIYNLEDAYQMVLGIGEVTDQKVNAQKLVNRLQLELNRSFPDLGTAIYLIWKNPIMVAGSNTFIDCMLEKAGFKNLIKTSRYPEISMDALKELSPDFLLLSSEPYPFKIQDCQMFQDILPFTQIHLVDGEMFSWYGSRLSHFSAYIHQKFSTNFN
jgi:ABC-type Fe3+-hydroxamate transport system substrate-binding protein